MQSRRNYLGIAELEEYANITVIDQTEAFDQISMAEEIIDAFVGYQCKFFEHSIEGKTVSAAAGTITLEDIHQNAYDENYFTFCQVEILDGTGSGQRRSIVSSTKEGVLTLDRNWTTVPDSTSYYQVTQLGKFPRREDVTAYTRVTPNKYLKRVPEAIRRAVAAQVEFIIEMGAAYFAGDKSTYDSERIGDYSYTRGGMGQATTAGGVLGKMVSEKSKSLLRGYINRKGVLIND